MAGFPYGLSLSSFLNEFDRSEQRRAQNQSVELRDLLATRQFQEADRKRQEEEAAMADLATELAARRQHPQMTTPLGLVPGAVPVERAETDIGPLETPTIPPREPFGASLAPAQQARLLASPRARPVIQSVEEAEKAQEQVRHREEAKQYFQSATERFRATDAAGGWEELAKAYNRLGQYGSGGAALGHAVVLRQDKEEEGTAAAELDTIMKATQQFQDDPSIKTHGDFLDALAQVKSKTNRALRTVLVENQLKAAIGRDPFSAMFWKELDREYQQAWQAGKPVTFEQALKAVQARNPGLVLRAVSNEMEKSKELPKALLQIFGVGEEVNAADLKDVNAIALTEFRRRMGRGPKSEDEVAGIITRANALAKARKQAEAEGTAAGKGEEPEARREAAALITQRNSLRLTVNSLRRELEGFPSPERKHEIQDELAQATTDLRFTEQKLRLLERLPPETPKLPVKPVIPPPRKPGAALTLSQQQLKARRDALVKNNYPGRQWADLSPAERRVIADLIDKQME